MRAPERKSYSPPFELGSPLGTLGVAEVLRSEDPAFPVGAHIYGFLQMEEYSYITSPAARGLKVLENKEGLP